MSVRLYDEALVNKIKSWLPTKTKLQVLRPDEVSRLYEINAQENSDQPIKLPLIAISRDPDVSLNLATWSSKSRDGYIYTRSEDKALMFKDIMIELNYQIDVYTKYAKEADSLLVELIYKLMLDNQITVDVKNEENLDIKHVSTITLDPTVRDTSDISERVFPGQFTRWTLTVSIKDAHLFSLPVKDLWSVETEKLDVEGD